MRITMKTNSALFQVVLVGLICFCCPGMYNAITAMAGGIGDNEVNNKANAWLYACFSITSLFAPAVCNIIGPRRTFCLGTLGYSGFVVGLYMFSQNMMSGAMVVLLAALNGVCAALLWTAQGQLCMAYPTQDLKGTYFAIFWVIFNIGGVVGGLITFFSNYSSEASTASGSTFLTFLAIMAVGSLLTLVLSSPDVVQRSDGSSVTLEKLPSALGELRAMGQLFLDSRVQLLIPMFLYNLIMLLKFWSEQHVRYSNWFLGYHFGVYNSGMFNTRTQGWNTAFYWGAEMLGAYSIGRFLDGKQYGSPRRRAQLALIFLFFYVNITWYLAWNILFGANMNPETSVRTPKLDLNDSASFGPFVLYFAWGFVDLTISSWVYWTLSQLTQDMNELGRFAGLYKSVQAGGAAIAWYMGSMDAASQLFVCWGIFLLAAASAWRMTKELEGGYLLKQNTDGTAN
eukprot:m.179345 g.179345  ORF g.179345 m.179345 type:complete len:455 (+) comp15475_c1_seq17:111-1475(+)